MAAMDDELSSYHSAEVGDYHSSDSYSDSYTHSSRSYSDYGDYSDSREYSDYPPDEPQNEQPQKNEQIPDPKQETKTPTSFGKAPELKSKKI